MNRSRRTFLLGATAGLATPAAAKSLNDWRGLGGDPSDTSMFRAALRELQKTGGRLDVPSGTYALEDVVSFDYSAASLTNGLGLSVEGAGSGSTVLRMQHDGAGLSFSCERGLAHANGAIRGIKILHAGPRAGTGIEADNISYWTLDDILFFNLEYGIRATDILSTSFRRVIARGNKHAIYLQGHVDQSPPNSITFEDCVLSENYERGLLVVRPRLIRVRGGSIEANGFRGVEPERYGIKIMEPRGPIATVIDGVYFTNNKGIADLFIDMARGEPCVVNVQGSQFTRISRDNYVTNHIRIKADAGDGKCLLVLTGNAFTKLNNYVELKAEPYVYVDGPGLVQVRDNGNLWQSPALKGAVDLHRA